MQLKGNCWACALNAKCSKADMRSVAVRWSDMRFSCQPLLLYCYVHCSQWRYHWTCLQKEQTSAAHSDICPSEDAEVKQNSLEFRLSSNVMAYLRSKKKPVCKDNRLPSVHLSICNLVSAEKQIVGFFVIFSEGAPYPRSSREGELREYQLRDSHTLHRGLYKLPPHVSYSLVNLN